MCKNKKNIIEELMYIREISLRFSIIIILYYKRNIEHN